MSFCKTDGSCLADNGDFHLSRICELVLNLLGDFRRELFGLCVSNLVSAYNHSQLAACLDGVGLDDTGI